MAGMTDDEWFAKYCSGRLDPVAWAKAKAKLEAPLPPLPRRTSSGGEA